VKGLTETAMSSHPIVEIQQQSKSILLPCLVFEALSQSLYLALLDLPSIDYLPADYVPRCSLTRNANTTFEQQGFKSLTVFAHAQGFGRDYFSPWRWSS
jgi:hypothetical protein